MKKKCFLPVMLLLIFTVCIFSETVIGQPAGLSLKEELQKLREAGIPTTIEELNLPEIPDKEKEVQTVQCKNNLQQIGSALYMYAQNHNGEFPDDPKILFSKNYISKLEILLCPGYTIPPDVKNPASGTIINYIYINGLNSQDNMSTGIVMYDVSSHNHGGFGRNVLFLDGHVRYYPEKDFQVLLEKFLSEYKDRISLIPVALPALVKTMSDEFKKNYVLSPGEELKYINPPLRSEGEHIIMCFRWEDEMLKEGSEGYGKINMANILRSLTGIHSYEIEGDKKILDTQMEGDFILRIGTPQETIIKRLEEIVQKDLNIPVKFTFREIERDVIVVAGYFKTNMVSKVEFYSTKHGGGGSDDFQELIKEIGDYIGCYVISEVINPPAYTFSWEYNQSKNIADKDSKFQNLSEQTGLTFKEDKRKVRVLFVERMD